MNACPSCGTSMKPLFVGFFCPNDCDQKAPSAKSLLPESSWEYKDRTGKRWKVTHVNSIALGPTVIRGWALTQDGINGAKVEDLLRDPQAFFRRQWGGALPGWRVISPQTANNPNISYLRIEEIP